MGVMPVTNIQFSVFVFIFDNTVRAFCAYKASSVHVVSDNTSLCGYVHVHVGW